MEHDEETNPTKKSLTRVRQRPSLKPEPPIRYDPLNAPFDEWKGTNGHPVHNPVYDDAAQWAKQVLDRDNLPADLALVEGQGFRKGDLERHAAAILCHWNRICSHWAGRKVIPISKKATGDLDRLIKRASELADPTSRPKRPGGKARGAQIRARHEKEHVALRNPLRN